MKRFCLLTFDFARRGGFAAGGAVVTALVMASLFAVALAPTPAVLTAAAVPVIWITLLLASLLSLESLWHRPLAQGRFDLLLMTGVSPLLAAAAAVLAHWLTAGLPLVVISILLVPMLSLPLDMLCLLLSSLALGTVYLSLLGGVGALLTYGARGAGLLLAVIILPLMLPMLLLGLLAAARWALVPFGTNPYLLLQAALVVLTAPLFVAAAGWLLRAQFSR